MGIFGWQDYAVTDGGGEFFMPLPDDAGVPAPMQLALFGPVGVTAYFGITEVARPNTGDVLVVSAAASAVGSLAGQIGKLLGCRVVGITGSQDKCRWLTAELGFDAAIDYKREPVFKRLRQHCPGGIDIYFDGVGGPMLEDALSLLNLRARVVICGMLAAYNDLGGTLALPPGPNNLLNLAFKRADGGFVCLDYCLGQAAFEAAARWHGGRQDPLPRRGGQRPREAPRAMNGCSTAATGVSLCWQSNGSAFGRKGAVAEHQTVAFRAGAGAVCRGVRAG
jgi:NADPH-dependent curcumin reductase CurA